MFTAALFTTAKTWKQAISNIYILLSYEKEWNNDICSNMDGPYGAYHAKWSKPDRERQLSGDIAYMWNLKI